jgi:tetratricopeptide (TPR) repeat protein
VLQLWGEHPELTRHLAAARRLLGGDDPVLLLYEGTQRQVLAGARTQRFFEDLRRAQGTTMISTAGAKPDRLLIDSMPSLPAALPTAGTSLAQAEGLFRRALSLDPSLAEARIRLAHVLGDRGRHDDAVAELDKLERTTGNLSPRLRYYAALMRGREARATGRLDAAGEAFQEALVVYPRASAARLGLSEIAMAEGDRSGSLAALTDGAAGARSELNEPWWGLERRHDPSAETLVADLRRSVPR